MDVPRLHAVGRQPRERGGDVHAAGAAHEGGAEYHAPHGAVAAHGVELAHQRGLAMAVAGVTAGGGDGSEEENSEWEDFPSW